MSQLRTLIWLKWLIFRNSLRSSKAVVNRLVSALAVIAALALSLLMATGLGFAAFALTSSNSNIQALQTGEIAHRGLPSAEFIFFSIFSMAYLIWATLPLSIGSSRQFDPGDLLLYPISLRKLFAVDLASEIVSIPSMFAIPSILAIGAGAGLAQGRLAAGLLIATLAAVFGIVLSKWISTSTGSLFKKKRNRGEGLLAFFGALAGLGGVLFAEVAPVLFRQGTTIPALRWTPPGAIAFALVHGLRIGGTGDYLFGVAILAAYTAAGFAITFWLARRSLLGSAGGRRKVSVQTPSTEPSNTGWGFPFVSDPISAVIEKELRYMLRNAQLRMMAVMPLILILVRLLNRRRFGPEAIGDAGGGFVTELLIYGEGLMAAAGVLYVFLILSGISCNLFAFESAGMRTVILSPVNRGHILVGKNIAASIAALMFSAALLLVNEVVFGDLTRAALVFACISFLIYAPLMAIIGNSLSIRFPKRMKFGSRLNVSGAVGLLMIPIILLLGLPPMAAVALGFVAQNLYVEYATLAVLAVISIGLYLLIIRAQGELLQQRELEILAVVTEPNND